MRASPARTRSSRKLKRFDSMSLKMIKSILFAAVASLGAVSFAAEDEDDGYELEDIPEELLETEEDRKKDERDEERARKLDRILNIAFAVSLIAVVAYALYKFLG